ncbi:MAG TPA: hypothetical protein VGJ15_13475 [Pirellulales bacterium]|jgi:hypothetical protein
MATLPDNVEVHELLPNGVHYVLPRRNLPKGVGTAILLGGMLAAVFSMLWIGMLGFQFFAKPNRDWFLLVHGLLALPILSGGITGTCFGYFLLRGHAEVHLQADTLQAIERAGILHWTWRQKVEQVDRLQVVGALDSADQKMNRLSESSDRFRIQAGSIFLAPGYPRPLCDALAEDLVARWRKSLDGDPSPQVPLLVKTAVAYGGKSVPKVIDRPFQPPGSRVQLEQTADSMTLRIPPAGLWRGSKGLIVVAVLWNLFNIGFIANALLGKNPKHGMFVGLFIFIALFGSVGIALLVAVVHMGRREAALAVAGDQLLVIQKSIFGKKRRQWSHADIASIGAGPSGMKVNNVPVTELQIRSIRGKKFGLLAGQPNDDLEWIATILRQCLNLPAMPTA